uniref:Uncharacterized protein n=1 Tax=Podoviridae sp. ct8Lf7 TaxID=2827723 RepID=A0A8S5S1S3_9CAUD|nr:MAG TPA: hypothetical protein [Podoviridae sp. ct8Lf7]
MIFLNFIRSSYVVSCIIFFFRFFYSILVCKSRIRGIERLRIYIFVKR